MTLSGRRWLVAHFTAVGDRFELAVCGVHRHFSAAICCVHLLLAIFANGHAYFKAEARLYGVLNFWVEARTYLSSTRRRVVGRL
jgi:hypothetical protein